MLQVRDMKGKQGFQKGNQEWKNRKKWTGEGGFDDRGYHRVSARKYEGKDNRERTHRVVMEKHLGRKLDKDEVVYHKDGDKTNNHISNLELMKRGEHSTHHLKIRWKKV